MDARPKSDMKFEVGKPISVELTDGRSMQGFVHAEDKGAGLLCLELIPSSEIALVSTVNIKNASASNDITEPRKWPSNRTYPIQRDTLQQLSMLC